MKRRTFLIAAAGGVLAAPLLWKPGDEGAPYDDYFAALNEALKRNGPGHPAMVVDLDRVDRNIDVVKRSIRAPKTYRVVVKSLPSVNLLGYAMERARTRALMAFHQPFLNAIAEAFPDADVLLGKPLPVTSARRFYDELRPGAFEPQRQLQWLIDTPARLRQYRALARELGQRLRVSVEIDVGLHRGGLQEPGQLADLLAAIEADPAHLELAGFMGYDAHLAGLPGFLQRRELAAVRARYGAFVDTVRERYPALPHERLTLNGAGSHTYRLYEGDALLNDLAAGSGLVKPTDFDTPLLGEHLPAAFIAAPVLKRSPGLESPVFSALGGLMAWWNPNRRQTFFIYGGHWLARPTSPAGLVRGLYASSNQEPVNGSEAVGLDVDDHVFLRPTQSEAVFLQFGDLLVTRGSRIVDRWPVFHQRG